MEKYLTSEQVAALLQVHPFTVLKYLKSGKLEGVKIGRVYRIKESDVEKFLSDNTIGNGKNHVSEDATPEPVLRKTEQVSTELDSKDEANEIDTHEIQFKDDEAKDDNVYYKI